MVKKILVVSAVALLVLAAVVPSLAAGGKERVNGKLIPYVIVHPENNGKSHRGGGPGGGGDEGEGMTTRPTSCHCQGSGPATTQM